MKLLRRRLFLLLEGWGQASLMGRIIDGALVFLICLNVVALTLGSIPEYHQNYSQTFLFIELVSVVIFSLEYLVRLWVCVESPDYMQVNGLMARVRCFMKPLMLVDLLAILPLYLLLFGLVGGADLRFLRFFRVLRILKLVRYSPAMQILTAVLRAEKQAILSALFIGLVMLFIASSMIHAVEGTIQPEAFGSIPSSMWWATATLTTVGYGDVTPITPLGKLVGGLVMLTGIGVFGLWAGIMASGFTEELRRRGFKVEWQMIARCPLFESLSSHELVQIAKELTPITVHERHLITRKAVEADAVYFIVSGQVEAELPQGVEILTSGDYFGELGILGNGLTSTTMVSLDEVRLLKMDRISFERLLANHEMIKGRTLETAKNRTHWFDKV